MSNYFYTQNTEDGVVQTLETPYNPTVLNHTTSSPISSNNIIVSSNAGSTPISSLFNNNNQPNLVNTIPDTNSDTFSSIFSQSNVIILLWFLAIYFLLFFLIRIFRGTESATGIIDFLILIVLVFLLITYYFSLSPTDRENIIEISALNLESFIDKPTSIFSVGLFLITFYIAMYLFSMPFENFQKPFTISFIENIGILLFIIIAVVDFFKYILGISLIDLLNRYFATLWKSPSVSSTTSTPIQSGVKNEVFNIANNLYTYDDAQAICKSYGARLASYDEIEKAYNDGAEWCNYGWSDDQMAFFPTQKSTWNNLQKDEKTKNNCGRPGVNGGYMANPYLKFGVNCFGQKPAPSSDNLLRMKQQQLSPTIPLTPEQEALDKKVQFWKENADKMLVVNSFNNNKWSEI